MALFTMVSGVLHRDIEQRTSKSGKPFAAGTLRYAEGEAQKFVRFTTFSADAIAALEKASAGDPIAITGSMRVDVWSPQDGEPRANLNVLADKVLCRPLTEKKARPRAAATPSQQYRRQAKAMVPVPPRGGAAIDDQLNDELGF